MNFIAKHFFDYQSFVNLPYKAVQLHKTPPSQAGVDPSASWAPKSMQVAGKNQPAPGARANRNNSDVRPGGHRHGRPTKLEFRNWGDRHGELHPEKNVTYKDAWMASLDGDFRHFHESDDEHEPSLADYIPRFSSLEDSTQEILVILTYAPKVEFITVTIKKLRGFGDRKNTIVKVQLFEGIALLEERHSSVKKLVGSPLMAGNHMNVRTLPNGGAVGHRRPPMDLQAGLRRRRDSHRRPLDEEVSESFLLHAAPHRLSFFHIIIQFYDVVENDPVGTFFGSCTIGSNSATSRGSFHWNQMVKKHGIPVCLWHKLSKPVVVVKEPVTAPASADPIPKTVE